MRVSVLAIGFKHHRRTLSPVNAYCVPGQLLRMCSMVISWLCHWPQPNGRRTIDTGSVILKSYGSRVDGQ